MFPGVLVFMTKTKEYLGPLIGRSIVVATGHVVVSYGETEKMTLAWVHVMFATSQLNWQMFSSPNSQSQKPPQASVETFLQNLDSLLMFPSPFFPRCSAATWTSSINMRMETTLMTLGLCRSHITIHSMHLSACVARSGTRLHLCQDSGISPSTPVNDRRPTQQPQPQQQQQQEEESLLHVCLRKREGAGAHLRRDAKKETRCLWWKPVPPVTLWQSREQGLSERRGAKTGGSTGNKYDIP